MAGVLRRGSPTYRSDSFDADLRRSFAFRNLNKIRVFVRFIEFGDGAWPAMRNFIHI